MAKKKTISDSSKQLVDAIVVGMQEVKAKDIVVLDLRSLSYAMSDFFVICHGGSGTQVQAIADSVEKETDRLVNDKPAHVEGRRNAKWVLLDYLNVVVHVFDNESRTFYGLEELWGDGDVKRID